MSEMGFDFFSLLPARTANPIGDIYLSIILNSRVALPSILLGSMIIAKSVGLDFVCRWCYDAKLARIEGRIVQYGS